MTGLPRFHLSADLRDRGLTGAYSLLLGFDQRAADTDQIRQFVDQVVASIRLRPQASAAVRAGYRAMHEAFQVPTRKLFSAPEVLARYVDKRGDIPRIGPLVDLYNAVSLETGLALGAHDLRAVIGDISLRLTDGSESYHPIGAPAVEPIRPGEYAYIDDANDVICRLEVRQVEKTKVVPTTTDVFLIVQGNAATPAGLIVAGHDRMISVLQRFLGGTLVPLFRP
ncbi:MAG: phenylalanine--tRNA ligase beta subunit-related protein [Azospirillaceae bacterium]|nr:phenylalanine--tRNA ligase beta subunit-related protein [Azospirillaceae bacterium]